MGANVLLVVDFLRAHPAIDNPKTVTVMFLGGTAYFAFIAHLVACGWALVARPARDPSDADCRGGGIDQNDEGGGRGARAPASYSSIGGEGRSGGGGGGGDGGGGSRK